MPPADPFARLTWDDVEEWAGHGIVHRGRGYRRDGAVRDLGRTVDGALLAVILTYLDYLKEETPVDKGGDAGRHGPRRRSAPRAAPTRGRDGRGFQ